ncbi:MAG TPA: tetratricopeptide repeat protein [Thermoanaerobaculia bacterium]|jgi:tetratricopeptide (TPR) repeat protein
MAIKRDKVIADAEKLVAKGKIEPAIKEYERLLDDNPNDVNTLNRIGDLWVRINRTDEAVKTFAKIADHYGKDGFFLKAIAIYKKINKLDPSKLDVYAKLADLYAKQGLAMEAKSQYQVLADYYIKHGDPGNALMIYRKISELDPNSINVHVKLADLHSQSGHTAEALKEYDRVGRMLLKRGMLDEAVQVFKKALKIDAKNVELVESLVAALIEAKDFNNAQQIIETALETNKNNPKLLAMWSRILIGKGDIASAKSSLERAMAADPNEPATREALAELYLKQNNLDKALEMIAFLSDKAVAKGERNNAVELLNRILRIDAGHIPTLERLVATYTRLNEETNILAAMNSLAEAHIAKGRYDQAATVLEKLIQREPQNAQHRNKLQFVKSKTGGGRGVDTMPPRRESAPPPVMEIEEPVPTMESLEEETPAAISLDDLNASPSMDLDLGGFSTAPGAPPPQMESGRSAPAAEEDGGDDLDFITEHLTEAEVFAKYGLAEKATEHLRAVIDRAPKHLPAHDKLFRILLDEADLTGARTAANQYVALLQEKGDAETIDIVKQEFTSRGHSFGTAAAAKRAMTADRPMPAAAPPPPPPPAEEEFNLEVEPVAGEELALEVEPEAAEETFMTFDTGVEPELSLEEEAPAAEEQPFFGVEAVASPEPEIQFEPEPMAELEIEPEKLQTDDLDELDDLIAEGKLKDARGRLDELDARFPGDRDLAKRKKRLDVATSAAEAVAAASKPKPAPPPPKAAPPPPPPPKPAAKPPALSRTEIESELLSAIPDEDDFPAAPPPPPPTAPAPPPPVVTAAQEENLFSDEENFFDLAAELESELVAEGADQISISEEEQSLEEIFKEFKKGVEQQLDSEDYDTHYNLGIAYKEMGLIDEAIGEFQLASKDHKRAVECASMLGLCFLEKGMPQLAIKWYRKGLDMPEIKEEEHLGLLYDLGSAYVEVGDSENAQKAFMEVYGLNTGYRDVANRIKQLEDASR